MNLELHVDCIEMFLNIILLAILSTNHVLSQFGTWAKSKCYKKIVEQTDRNSIIQCYLKKKKKNVNIPLLYCFPNISDIMYLLKYQGRHDFLSFCNSIMYA